MAGAEGENTLARIPSRKTRWLLEAVTGLYRVDGPSAASMVGRLFSSWLLQVFSSAENTKPSLVALRYPNRVVDE